MLAPKLELPLRGHPTGAYAIRDACAEMAHRIQATPSTLMAAMILMTGYLAHQQCGKDPRYQDEWLACLVEAAKLQMAHDKLRIQS